LANGQVHSIATIMLVFRSGTHMLDTIDTYTRATRILDYSKEPIFRKFRRRILQNRIHCISSAQPCRNKKNVFLNFHAMSIVQQGIS